MPEPRFSVLMTTDAVGGVWSYSVSLARELIRHGATVTLVVLGPPATEEQRRTVPPSDALVVFECPEALEWMDDPWEGVARSGEFLLELQRRLRPDIVHLNGYVHAALPFGCPKVVVAHSCVLSWWEAVKGEPAPARYSRYRRAVAAGLRQADQVVAPSAAMLQCVQRHYGQNRACIIANGLEPPASTRHPKEPLVFCAGRIWDEAKNVRTLVAAASSVRAPVFVAGSGTIDDAHVKHLGVLDRKRLCHWYERAAVYASPVLYEPFGLAALEAASHGAALVLGDIPSQREIWGDAAVFVPPRNHGSLAAVLNHLLGNSELRLEMARRAERRARRYSLTKQVRLYLSLYSHLIRRSSAGWASTRAAASAISSTSESNHANHRLLSLVNQ